MVDKEGVLLADMEEVREEARRRAFLLLSEGYRDGRDRSGSIIDVRDEAGDVVLSLTLREAVS